MIAPALCRVRHKSAAAASRCEECKRERKAALGTLAAPTLAPGTLRLPKMSSPDAETLAWTTRDPEVVAALARDKRQGVRHALAGNPLLPAETIRAWFDSSHALAHVLAANPNTPTDLIESVLVPGSGHNANLMSGALANPNAPEGIVREHGRHGVTWQKEAVARNPRAPKDVLTELAGHQDWQVRELVAKNPGVSKTTFAQLASDPSRDVRWARYANPSMSEEELLTGARVGDTGTMDVIRRNPLAPDEAIAIIASRATTDSSREFANDAVQARICARFDISPDDARAIEFLAAKEWWALTPDDAVVRVALRVMKGER